MYNIEIDVNEKDWVSAKVQVNGCTYTSAYCTEYDEAISDLIDYLCQELCQAEVALEDELTGANT